jgi:hypothetical protein
MRRASANAPRRAGASATEGGDEHAGVRRAPSFVAATTRRASANALHRAAPRDGKWRCARRCEKARSVRAPALVVHASADDRIALFGDRFGCIICITSGRRSRTARGNWTSVSRLHAAASLAGNDAPLIDERAATRGRTATGGGDEPPPHQTQSWSGSIHEFAKFLARFEEGNILRRHCDAGSGFWITSDASTSLARVEASESADFNLVAGSQSTDDTVKYGTNDDVGFLAGYLYGLINLFGQIGSLHLAYTALDHENEYHSVPWCPTLPAPFVAATMR